MGKLSPISGFPELLPAQKMVEERVVETIRQIYKSHGFVPIETPAVELMTTLAAKGVVEREIYQVQRVNAAEEEEAQLGLHFDLTVPFARYVAQHFNELKFPFKRYQMQKVWRGERPQKGRFREFYQFDIDVIAQDELPISCDAEVLTVFIKALKIINIGRFQMNVNSRKVLLGLYRSLGIDEKKGSDVIREVDKLHKVGAGAVKTSLVTECQVSEPVADTILKYAAIRCTPADAVQTLEATGVKDEVFQQGIKELGLLLSLIPSNLHEHLVVNLSMARGLDYYTGTIFEVVLSDYPEFGSVCSGGRYDNLASQFTNKKLPGMGGSIGLSRLMDFVLSNKILSAETTPPVKALVAVFSEEQRPKCIAVAETLRENGVSAEVYFKAPKIGKQIDYAATRNIPYVLFVNPETSALEVKDLTSKEQKPIADLKVWCNAVR